MSVFNSALSPGPPANVVFDETSDSVTIRWERPTVVHSHYPITGYMVMWGDPSSDMTFTHKLPPVRVNVHK